MDNDKENENETEKLNKESDNYISIIKSKHKTRKIYFNKYKIFFFIISFVLIFFFDCFIKITEKK